MTVKEVQARLKALGYDIGKTGVDGRSGPAYQRAVKAFQIANGLTADGKVGPLTLAALDPVPVKAPTAVTAGLPTYPAPPPVAVPVAGKNAWPLQRDCMTYYGGVGLNQTTLVLPYPMKVAWDKKTLIRKFSIHEKVHDSAARAFEKIANAYDEKQRAELGLDLFGGCLNVRKMRGGSSYSMHSWGIAIDFDPERNTLKMTRSQARLAKPDCEEFWRIWESEGWVSLGRHSNYDWMHVQAARI